MVGQLGKFVSMDSTKKKHDTLFKALHRGDVIHYKRFANKDGICLPKAQLSF